MSTINAQNFGDGTDSVPASAVIQGTAKAWVNFNGTGTVSIRESYNVGSITDNGSGEYTVNFTTAMPDVNYAVQTGIGNETTHICGLFRDDGPNQIAPTVSSFSIFTFTRVSSSGRDAPYVNAAVFR